MSKYQDVETVKSATTTAVTSGKVLATGACTLIAKVAATGASFGRSFPNIDALNRWVATDPNAGLLDLSEARVVATASF